MSRPIDEQVWHRLTAEIMSGMREWREAHPKATLREIEQELDHRWVRVRARMLEDMALASVAADWVRQEMQRQFEMINDAMVADTLKPYTNAEYRSAREALLTFPDARITYVRCEVSKQTGATRPAGCQ